MEASSVRKFLQATWFKRHDSYYERDISASPGNSESWLSTRHALGAMEYAFPPQRACAHGLEFAGLVCRNVCCFPVSPGRSGEYLLESVLFSIKIDTENSRQKFHMKSLSFCQGQTRAGSVWPAV